MPDAVTLATLQQLAAALPETALSGTSSWTYPGWTGLVYDKEYPKTGATAQMLEEYARYPLFRTVGIDNPPSMPPRTARTLESYAYLFRYDYIMATGQLKALTG